MKIQISKENGEGRVKGADFEELKASIKEKGVLMPILVRELNGGVLEIVAGHRRYQAAVELAMAVKDIPMRVVKMTDIEAMEARIVENLQRKDVHPMEEGIAYRNLMEKSKPRYTTKDIALKVGKSEVYVRQRLGLTNLFEKARAAFRAEKMSISHAVLLSRLEDEKDQAAALKEVVEYNMSPDRLRDWIQNRVFTNLNNKPWAKDAKLAEMVGDTGGKMTLFDKNPTSDPVDYATQMAAWIELKTREAKEKGEKLVKISRHWGTPDNKKALARSQYEILNGKADGRQEYKAIVVEGEDLGRMYRITTELKEKGSEYKLSDEEKAKRKKDKMAEEAKEKKLNDALTAELEKIKWPLTEKKLDVLLDLTFTHVGASFQQPICKRHGVKADVVKEKNWTTRNYEKPLRRIAEKGGTTGKLRMVFELLSGGGYWHVEDSIKALKK